MPSTSADASRPPPEILNFIEKQEGYIEQLERESQFCRVSGEFGPPHSVYNTSSRKK